MVWKTSVEHCISPPALQPPGWVNSNNVPVQRNCLNQEWESFLLALKVVAVLPL